VQCECEREQLLLNLDLRLICGDDFGRASILGNLARNADLPVPILRFGATKLAPVASPDDYCENLPRVWLV
jgi:hypothetical protein